LASSLADLVLSKLPRDGEHIEHEREALETVGIEEVNSM
jgi:hypothetical protein